MRKHNDYRTGEPHSSHTPPPRGTIRLSDGRKAARPHPAPAAPREENTKCGFPLTRGQQKQTPKHPSPLPSLGSRGNFPPHLLYNQTRKHRKTPCLPQRGRCRCRVAATAVGVCHNPPPLTRRRRFKGGLRGDPPSIAACTAEAALKNFSAIDTPPCGRKIRNTASRSPEGNRSRQPKRPSPLHPSAAEAIFLLTCFTTKQGNTAKPLASLLEGERRVMRISAVRCARAAN